MRLFSEAVKNVTLVTGGVWGSEGVISDKKESSVSGMGLCVHVLTHTYL